eukprot:6645069-Ditylum_brightwellii.AAC.2
MPYNTNSSTYDLVVLFFDTGTIEEWLKFVQNLSAVIKGQNINNAQGAYVITKNLLQGNALAFENTEGVNGPQTSLNYEQTIKDVHLHISPPQAYIMQICYTCRALIKHFKMSTHKFVACVNKINKQLAQFPPRDNRTPQEKLADDKITDILKNTIPKM